MSDEPATKRGSVAAVVEMVDAIDQKHEAAHDRLRHDFMAVEQKVESNYTYFRDRSEGNKSRIEEIAAQVDNLQRAPVNIDKLIFTPRVVGTIALTLLAIYGFTASLRSDVHDLRTLVDAKQVVDKARADLQDVQSAALRTDVTEMKRQLTLQQLEIQNLKDLIAKGRR